MTVKRSFYLKPVDTFFFKGQQTTEAGEDTHNTGIFPPRPNTVYGALRAAYIHEHSTFDRFAESADEAVKKWMGTPDELGEFSIAFNGLMFRNELVLPLPLDYQVIEKDGKFKAYPLQPVRSDLPASPQTTGWLLQARIKEKSKSAAPFFVKIGNWKTYLLSGKPADCLLTISDFVSFEDRIGIALDYGKQTKKESYLYRMRKLRFKDNHALYVYSSSAPDFKNVRFVRLGGENRPWLLQQTDESFTLWTAKEIEHIKEQIRRTGMAKIILLTPAIWKKGSRPEAFDGQFVTLPNGLKTELLTAAVGRPDLYGGWDIANHRPKKRYYMVPRGSVLYVNVWEEQLNRFLELAGGFSFTDYGKQEGFGFAVIAPVIHD